MNDGGAAETVPVNVTVLKVEPVAGSRRLLGLAEVEIDIDGVVIGVHGLRVVSLGPLELGVEAPTWRSGATPRPAISLPAELKAAIADVVLDAFGAMRRALCRPAAGRLEPPKQGSPLRQMPRRRACTSDP